MIKNKDTVLLSAIGLIPVIWIALLAAPYASGSIFDMVSSLDTAMSYIGLLKIRRALQKMILLYGFI